MERKYAMTRIESGDYMWPSNDGQTLWRAMRYREDGSIVGPHKITGWRWNLWRFRGTLTDAETLMHTDTSEFLGEHGDFEQHWEMEWAVLRSRDQCIKIALEREERVAATQTP